MMMEYLYHVSITVYVIAILILMWGYVQEGNTSNSRTSFIIVIYVLCHILIYIVSWTAPIYNYFIIIISQISHTVLVLEIASIQITGTARSNHQQSRNTLQKTTLFPFFASALYRCLNILTGVVNVG